MTDFEARVMLAIHWFAQSIAEDSHASQILSLMIALEALFTRGGATRHVIAEGVAILVGQTLEERKRLYRLTSQAYAYRNAVVHEGEADPQETTIREMQKAVHRLISRPIAMSDKFSAAEQMRTWIRDQQFSYFGH